MARSSLLTLTVLFALSASAVAISDVDILNFALNIECLQASFYTWAAYGQGLSAVDLGGGPPARGGQKAFLSPDGQAYAANMAVVETAHLRLLRQVLGKRAVPCPLVDIGDAFVYATAIAFNQTRFAAPPRPYGDDVLFFLGAFMLEDAGVTVYTGLTDLLKFKTNYVMAGRLAVTEAYQSGAIRAKLYEMANDYLFPFNVTINTICSGISALRSFTGGGKDQGIINSLGSVQIAPVDAAGLAYGRSFSQALSIFYLGFPKGGGFFPNGFSGLIR